MQENSCKKALDVSQTWDNKKWKLYISYFSTQKQ
jgi:hypothetical protein